MADTSKGSGKVSAINFELLFNSAPELYLVLDTALISIGAEVN